MQVRALVKLLHDGVIYEAGQVFEYADELAKQLKGDISEGMELVTKKTNAAFAKAQAEAQQALEDAATSLRANYDALKAELEADPQRGDLVQKVLDAESAAIEAEKAANAHTDLV